MKIRVFCRGMILGSAATAVGPWVGCCQDCGTAVEVAPDGMCLPHGHVVEVADFLGELVIDAGDADRVAA